MQHSTRKVMENALSAFFSGYTEAERELKKVSYQFIDTVLNDIADKGTYDEVFSCSIER